MRRVRSTRSDSTVRSSAGTPECLSTGGGQHTPACRETTSLLGCRRRKGLMARLPGYPCRLSGGQLRVVRRRVFSSVQTDNTEREPN